MIKFISTSNKITLYIPTLDEKIAKDMVAFLTECFGGATSTPALVERKTINGIVREKMTLVVAHYNNEEEAAEKLEKVISECETLKEKNNLEFVILDINGEAHTI